MFITIGEIKVGDVIIDSCASRLVVYEVIGITKKNYIKVKEFKNACWHYNPAELFNTCDITQMSVGEQVGVKYLYKNYFYLLQRKYNEELL